MNGKTQAVRIHRNLWLYKQPGSRCWYARVSLGGTTKAKSTGTTDFCIATRHAEDFFIERLKLQGNGLGGQSVCESLLQSRRFDRIADDYLDQKRSTLCDSEWRNMRNLLTSANGPIAFFARMDVGDITTDKVRRYLEAAERDSTTGIRFKL